MSVITLKINDVITSLKILKYKKNMINKLELIKYTSLYIFEIHTLYVYTHNIQRLPKNVYTF